MPKVRSTDFSGVKVEHRFFWSKSILPQHGRTTLSFPGFLTGQDNTVVPDSNPLEASDATKKVLN